MSVLSLATNPADKVLSAGWRGLGHERQPIGSLWVGSLNSLDRKFLSANHIGVVISLCPVEGTLSPSITHHYYEVNDDHKDIKRMKTLLPNVIDTIHRARLRGHNVLVHCRGGMQRAPTVTALYLKTYYYPNDPINKVIHKIQTVRPIAFSNGYTFKTLLK